MDNNQIYNQVPEPVMPPPLPPMPMSRRTRWGKQLMLGKAIWLQTLPDWFATYAVATYAIALLGVNLVYSSYTTEWYFWLFGIIWVAGFFFLTVKFSRDWSVTRVKKSKVFEKKLFRIGLALRITYAIIIYYFYISMTGVPHEYSTVDSTEYIETARWFLEEWQADQFWTTLTEMSRSNMDDLGYPLFLFLPASIIEDDGVVLLIQIIQAVI